MTTIVWNPRTREIGCDGRMSWGNGEWCDNKYKLIRGRDFYLALAGAVALWDRFLHERLAAFEVGDTGSLRARNLVHEYEALEKLAKDDNACDALMWIDTGTEVALLCFTQYGGFVRGDIDRINGIGSGSHYAMGAMQMGATTEQALQVAEALDLGSGGQHTIYKPFIDTHMPYYAGQCCDLVKYEQN